jgi:hypothetical protein
VAALVQHQEFRQYDKSADFPAPSQEPVDIATNIDRHYMETSHGYLPSIRKSLVRF